MLCAIQTVRLRLHANYVNDSEIDAKLVSFKGAIGKLQP